MYVKRVIQRIIISGVCHSALRCMKAVGIFNAEARTSERVTASYYRNAIEKHYVSSYTMWNRLKKAGLVVSGI
mgnify:CR=1 FL=1